MAGINNKKVWVNGDDTDAAWFNAAQNPTFTKNPATDDLINPNENWQLTNVSLSRASGNILPEWETFRDTFKVVKVSGLIASYQGGTVLLPNNTIATILPGTISVPNNATSICFITASGIVDISTTCPILCLPIATIIASGGQISAITSLRSPSIILPKVNTLQLFGGSGTDGSYSLSGTGSLSGTKKFTSFNIAATGVLTTNGFLYILCSGAVNIDGQIVSATPVAGGSSFGGSAPLMYFLPDPGRGIGGGGGHNATPSSAYDYTVSALSSGGSSGFGQVNGPSATFITSKGGNGGGTVIIEAAGPIAISGSILCNGENSIQGSVIEYSTAALSLSGGGGGSGGLIWLKSLERITISGTAVLSCKGGNGSNGVGATGTASPAGGYGGGGGGGGYTVISSPVNSIVGNIYLNGGLAGSNSSTPQIAGSNGGSFGGVGGGSNTAGSAGQLITSISAV
jgi:hypothetical protein